MQWRLLFRKPTVWACFLCKQKTWTYPLTQSLFGQPPLWGEASGRGVRNNDLIWRTPAQQSCLLSEQFSFNNKTCSFPVSWSFSAKTLVMSASVERKPLSTICSFFLFFCNHASRSGKKQTLASVFSPDLSLSVPWSSAWGHKSQIGYEAGTTSQRSLAARTVVLVKAQECARDKRSQNSVGLSGASGVLTWWENDAFDP